MALTCRLCSYHRIFRSPIRVVSFKRSFHDAPKENTDLLNSYNQDIKSGGVVPVFRRALLFPSRVAIHDEQETFTYEKLYRAANKLSQDIEEKLSGEKEKTIAYMCGNNASHVVTQWAIWMTGNIAVPLTPIHPREMLKYFMTDSGASIVICTTDHENLLGPIASELSKPLLVANKEKKQDEVINESQSSPVEVGPSNLWYGGKDAMLIYTSGTTSKPKGVVWTHTMLSTQIAALHSAWQYSANDVVLHTLPLHHIHGQLNSLNATLAAGARIRMLASFGSQAVWSRLLGTAAGEDVRISVYHGVPAMYARLSADHATMFTDPKAKENVRNTLSKMRLMCAGSAPLPETLFNKWEEISGLRLLERYGMSEVGMALSNPYRPVEERRVGCVGSPLPGVAARISVSDGNNGYEPLVTVESDLPDLQISLDKLGFTKTLIESNEWKQSKVTVHKSNKDGAYEGELFFKGPNVFTRYWNRAPNTENPDFTPDGWFRTGDIASFKDGVFRILGRSSVDIIKTGGYKVSALQVESAILEHPSIADAAVLGIEDDSYGEIVSTVVVLKESKKLTLKELKEATGKKLAPYQLPKTMLIVETMPRNVMGKLDKKEIRRLFGEQLVFKRS